eukprot:TRINITY_DN38360_c0_g1_i1.p1 TRINITY_DN38360_c0_g1~~TRINITY_DN38360_c0_g1_i1.p1  ORF type:complete len:298 (+),score=21.14 TRINITY_DN38360_c0_g1_i1:737-1630(+)
MGDLHPQICPSPVCSPLVPSSAHPKWTADILHANGMDLHFYYSPPRQHLPVLVFLHGLSSSGAAFIPLISHLTDSYTVFLPDARAHGRSTPIPPNSFTLANLLADLLLLLKHISPEAPVYLAGHSMGASLAARLAQAHPDLVRALILVDPPWGRMPGDSPRQPPKGQKSPLDSTIQLQALSDEEFAKINPTLPAGVDALAMTAQEAARCLDISGMEPTLMEAKLPLNEGVLGLVMPVLLQSGTVEAGAKLPGSLADLCLKSYPKGRHVNYPGAHHEIHEHSGSAWLADVRTFLQSCS